VNDPLKASFRAVYDEHFPFRSITTNLQVNIEKGAATGRKNCNASKNESRF
jgi:hypothetical protein